MSVLTELEPRETERVTGPMGSSLPSPRTDSPPTTSARHRVVRRGPQHRRRRNRQRSFGLLVAGAFVSLGAAVLVKDYAWARTAPPNYSLFWFGTFCMFVPLVLLALSRRSSERIVVSSIALIGLSSYLPSFLRAPGRPVFGDAMGHYLSVEEALRTGQLFTANAVVPISKFYPGLHVVVAAIVRLTGAPIWGVATFLIACAHVATVLGIYAICTAFTPNKRGAALAAVIYSISPEYIFFDGLFAYESLAMPLLVWTLAFALHANNRRNDTERFVLVALSGVTGLCCALTHHITSYALAVLLIAIAIFQLLYRQSKQARLFLGLGGFIGICAIGWVVLTGAPIVSYLDYFPRTAFDSIGPIFHKVLGEHNTVIVGSAPATPTRSLFTGSTLPPYERYAAYVVQIISLVGLCAGFWRLRKRLSGPIVALALLAFSYFILLPLRLSPAGEAGAGRVSTFQWVGIAVVAGIGLAEPALVRATRAVKVPTNRTKQSIRLTLGALSLCALCVSLVGNFGTGVNAAEQFPGRFQLDSSNGTDTPLRAVRLAESFLKSEGAGRRVISDGSTERIFETYAFTEDLGDLPQWQFYYANTYSSGYLESVVRSGGVSAIVIDRRVTNPEGEVPGLLGYPPSVLPPIKKSSLDKLASFSWLRVVQRSGSYEVLQVLDHS